MSDSSRQVLIVDDNHDAAASLGRLMTLLGHHPVVVTSAADALHALQSFTPEVAFIDLAMPKTNGLDLAKQLRVAPGLENLKLVAFTGYGDANHQRLAEAAGFDLYLVKPAKLEAVQNALA